MLNKMLKKLKQNSRKVARIIKKIKKYFIDIINEVLKEERATIKTQIAFSITKSVQILSVGFVVIVLGFTMAIVISVVERYNIDLEMLKGAYSALIG